MYQGLQTVTLTEILDPNAKVERPAWQPLTIQEEEKAIDILFSPKREEFDDCSFVGHSLAQTRAKFGEE
jgi:hypothetical protein